MTTPVPWPDPDETIELPIDALAIHILCQVAGHSNPPRPVVRQQFIEAQTTDAARTRRGVQSGATLRYAAEDLREHADIARALSEAWDWLVTEGLFAIDPVAIGVSTDSRLDTYFVTRWGREVAAAGPKGLDISRARRRLGLELHPALAEPLRKLINVGAFEQAAFTALREIEQRVRALAGQPKGKNGGTLRGEPLMTEAFRPGGILSDPEAEVAEQQGQMNLFKGAFAAFRNPLGHTSIEFDDPIEAAEVVLFADLLMRQLDHVGGRLKQLESHG